MAGFCANAASAVKTRQAVTQLYILRPVDFGAAGLLYAKQINYDVKLLFTAG